MGTVYSGTRRYNARSVRGVNGLLLAVLLGAAACAGPGTAAGQPSQATTSLTPASSPTDTATDEACGRLQDLVDAGEVLRTIPSAMRDHPTPEDSANYARVENQRKETASALLSLASRVGDMEFRDALRLIATWHLAERLAPEDQSKFPGFAGTAAAYCQRVGHPLQFDEAGAFGLLV